MTDSTHKQRWANWHLITFIGVLIAISALMDAAGFVRFAPSLGVSPWVCALAVVPVKLAELLAPIVVLRLCRASWIGVLLSPVFAIMWVAAVTLSAIASHATIHTVLTSLDRSATMKAETRANVATGLARVNGQLDAYPKPLPRAVATVEAELGWATSRQPPIDCARAPDVGSRQCKKIFELRKELAASRDYERLGQESAKMSAVLADLPVEAANPMPSTFEAMAGWFTTMDGTHGIALLAVLIFALGSAAGPFAFEELRWQVAPADPKPALEVQPALDPAQGQTSQGADIIAFPSAHPDRRPPIPPSGRGRRAAPAPRPDQPYKSAPRAAQSPPKGKQKSKGGRKDDVHGRPAVGRVDDLVAAAAVRAYVGTLQISRSGREMGACLFAAYGQRRLIHGWPRLPPNVFGIHLAIAVKELGGRKLKSGGQVYEGVSLPAAWRAPLAQAA